MEESGTKVKKDTRDVNIEILRIIAMLMVIILHCFGRAVKLNDMNMYSLNYIVLLFINFLASVANGIFIIITGYYMCNKPLKLKKVLLLWGKTLFYSVAIYIIFCFIGEKSYVKQSFFPVISGSYWFISAYITLCFFSPIINILINKMTKKQFQYLICILLITYSFLKVFMNPAGIFLGGFAAVVMIYIIRCIHKITC